MITHELLILAIQAKWPDLVHGKDFLVAHPIDVKTGEQKGPAYIMVWAAKGIPKPTPVEESMLRIEATRMPPALQTKNVRAQRDQLILASDFTQHEDVQASMPLKQKAAWKDYRQALRDITKQPGFPATIDWPVKPV